VVLRGYGFFSHCLLKLLSWFSFETFILAAIFFVVLKNGSLPLVLVLILSSENTHLGYLLLVLSYCLLKICV
jgi:hypothetical protein